ncbi:nicotinamide-nucleotide amidohydrolase family protein [Nitratifractor salsuginis]|uniref:CinA domain protein n=1 Tax=Nitratifractor salsuginis (strain DSM 16511 / JCM 12458 / E9I37-1) TaxID=749222 RepID=E6X1G1_NITSE|nr:nicotinamide-nucleotide amidohydrolase family protein [Nitratifractor salsuginis]ADV45894.1 CinA domain protein [Nitratifractor salsuginis DSM 16511]
MPRGLTLLYLGESLSAHPTLPAYLHRALAQKGLKPVRELRIKPLDPDLPLLLQKILEEPRGDLLIAATEESFALAGRILCTLGNEALETREGMLLPASAEAVEPDSYRYRLQGRAVNVLRLLPWQTLPPILLEPVAHRIYHFFTETDPLPEDLGIVDPLRESERLPQALRELALREVENLGIVPILPGWYRLELRGEESLDDLEASLAPWQEQMIPGPSLVESLIQYFSATGRKITFAESCTGGRLAATFTSEPGASDILEGSYVTYANRIKSGWLGVREETLRDYGAVSRECVLEMAAGARERVPADLAVAISGIAGPTGAVPGKPVGTVYLCLRDARGPHTARLQLHGDRNAIQDQSVLYALSFIVRNEKEKIFKFFSENS